MKERPVKLAIVGSREFTDYLQFRRALEPYRILSFTNDTKWWIEEVVSGGARGADAMAAQWCRAELRKEPTIFEAKWRREDGSKDPLAGFARNSLIAEHADCCIAFWDMNSNGTLDTIEKFRKLGKPVLIVPVGEKPCRKST